MISLLETYSCFAGKCCIFAGELALPVCDVSWNNYLCPFFNKPASSEAVKIYVLLHFFGIYKKSNLNGIYMFLAFYACSTKGVYKQLCWLRRKFMKSAQKKTQLLLFPLHLLTFQETVEYFLHRNN